MNSRPRATGLPSLSAAGPQMDAGRRGLLLAFALALVGLLLLGVVSYRATRGLVGAADGLQQAERIRSAVMELLVAFQDVGRGARGFALSGDEAHLAGLRNGATEAQRRLAELQTAGAQDPTLAAGLAPLPGLLAERAAAVEQLVALRRETGSANDARMGPALTRTESTMERARVILGEIAEKEGRAVAARAEELDRQRQQMIAAVGALVGFGALLLAIGVWAVRRETAALHHVQETLRRFLDAAPDASIMVDERGTIVFANAQAERFFGWPRAELLGQPVEVLVPERTRGGHVAQRERYTSDPQPRPMGAGLELNARTRDGRDVPVEISLSPIATSGGRFVTASVRDITERRLATERLREARAFADRLVETVREPLVVLDGDLRIVRANRAFYRFFALGPRATIGVSLFALADGQWNVPALRQALAELLPRDATLDGFELEQEVPGRGRCSLVLHARPVERDEAGAETILVAIEDETERRRNERLLVERRALERVNADLQEFAYAASHDLQEPLRKIRTFGDRILQRWGGDLPGDGRDYLQRMQNAAARMQTLIDDLLAFSRVSTRAQPFEPVDLALVAHEVVQDLEARIEDTGGRVVVEALPTIEADPVQMRQLLQNLMGNGLKFHRPGHPPTVRVGGEIHNGPNRRPALELRVTDDGIGFDEKYLDRIFTIFQRLHGRSEYEGTGLGLAICRKIVERHRGHITARSHPGQGATFVVTLPVSQGDRP